MTATVVGKSPNIWYSTVWIDKGTSSGVHDNDPVVNEEGLVGKVALTAPDGACVDLITDSEVGVSARINGTNATGVVQPKVGDPNDLVLRCFFPAVPRPTVVKVSSPPGRSASPDDSLYRPGIPIGQVTSEDEESGFKSVNVHPLADLHNLDVVQVLTYTQDGMAGPSGRVCRSHPAEGRAEQTDTTAGGEGDRSHRPRRGSADAPSRLAPHTDRRARSRRRVLPDRRRLGGAGVRRYGRSVTARRRLRWAAVRFDDRARPGLRSACSSTSRWCRRWA